MRYPLLLVTAVAWALWLGGAIALFVFGFYFFHHLPENVSRDAARAMFAVFSPYQLVLAAVALTGTGLLLVTYPSKWLVLLLGTFIMAGGMAVTVGMGLLPQMEILHNRGKVDTPQWRKLHGQSMLATAMESGVLVLSGAILLMAVRQPRPMTELDLDGDPELAAAGRAEPLAATRRGL